MLELSEEILRRFNNSAILIDAFNKEGIEQFFKYFDILKAGIPLKLYTSPLQDPCLFQLISSKTSKLTELKRNVQIKTTKTIAISKDHHLFQKDRHLFKKDNGLLVGS